MRDGHALSHEQHTARCMARLVGKVGLHASASDGAVNVHRAKVMVIPKISVHHVVVCVCTVHGMSGYGGVSAVQSDVD